jgi:hypothetical protein
MAVIKKHATSSNVVDIGDGVFAEQVNYGTSTGGLRSVTDVIVRHMEDYNAKFIPNRLYNSTLGRSNLDFTVPANSYATINGRWVKVSTDETESVTATNGTYIVYLTATNASSDEENRNPNTDTVSLEHVLVGSYVDSQLNLPVAKVVVAGGAYSSHVDLHADGTGLMRVDSLRAFGGSDIHIYAGDFPQDSLVAEFRTDKFMTASSIDVDIGGDLILDSVTVSAIQTSGESFVDNDTSLMTSAAILDKIQEQVTAEDLDISADTGTIAIDLDSETLTLTGGTGITTTANTNDVSFAIDGTVVLQHSDVDDTAVNGATDVPISSNWAFDHDASSTAHHTKYALTDDLASGEITQLQNIGSTTISATQWGYVGEIDDIFALGSSNLNRIQAICHNDGKNDFFDIDDLGKVSIPALGSETIRFSIPLPLTMGNKELFIAGFRMRVFDADPDDKILSVKPYRITTTGSTSTGTGYTTEITSIGNVSSTWSGFNADPSQDSHSAGVQIEVSALGTVGHIDFYVPQIYYYYA